MKQLQKYLVVKGCAGLGNRLVTVFSAIRYCEQNKRVLVVDWSDGQFDVNGSDAFRKCFDLFDIRHLEIENIKNWDELTHSSALFKASKNKGIYNLYSSLQSSFWSRFPRLLFFLPVLRKLRRRWQPIGNEKFDASINYGSDLANGMAEDVLYYADFLPYMDYSGMPQYIKTKSFLTEKIDAFAQQYNLTEAVGVHIRFTDKQPTSDVKKIIDHIKSKHQGDPIYLSTDSVEIEKLFSASIPDLILFPKAKPSLNGEGLHQWALRHKQEDLKYPLYEESIIEMFSLSKCKHLYYQGNSTFSNISKVYHISKSNCYDWLKL